MSKRELKNAEMFRLVEELESSGCDRQVFASQHGISLSKLDYWRLTSRYESFTTNNKQPNSPFWWFMRDVNLSYEQHESIRANQQRDIWAIFHIKVVDKIEYLWLEKIMLNNFKSEQSEHIWMYIFSMWNDRSVRMDFGSRSD